MSNIKSTKLEGELDEGEELEQGHDLTAMQEAFVAAFTDGPTAGNNKKSAEAAGYSPKTAGAIGCALLKLPHVVFAIEARMREAISTTLTVKSVALISRMIDDDNTPPKLRASLAVKVVEFSGLAERVQVEKARQTGLGTRKLTELTRDELADLVRQGAAVLADQAANAKTIEGTLSGDKAHVSAQPKQIAAE